MTYWNTAEFKVRFVCAIFAQAETINLEIMKIMRKVASIIAKKGIMDKNTELKDTAIRVHIKHTQPVEVSDFVASLTSIENLFTSYMRDKAECKEEVQAKLYVEKIKEGSIDIWMIAPAIVGLIAFADNTNKLCDFIKHINDFVRHFTQGLNPGKKYTVSELKCLKGVLAPTSNDRDGQLIIEAININNSKVIMNGVSIGFVDSNSVQNQIDKEIESRKSAESTDGIYRKVLMQIYQVRKTAESNVGNKAIIDHIFVGKRLPVWFETDDLKSTILYSDYNPTRTGFVVDVEVMTIDGKPKVYKVVRLYEAVPLNDDD